MNKKFNAKQLTLLGLMTALLLLMSFTPLGYLNIGPLAITFNVIPVAVSALALRFAVLRPAYAGRLFARLHLPQRP